MNSILDSINPYRRVAAGRDRVKDYMIDTCYTSDCGWETAVWRGCSRLVIVEYYSSQEKAIEGHDKWRVFCANEPKGFWDVDIKEYVRI